jgi:uncharacterized protein YegP (UPF0339 family)
MYRLWKDSRDGLWYWNLRAGNHVVMLKGPKGYHDHDMAQKDIKAVWRWAKTKRKAMHTIEYTEGHFADVVGYRIGFLVKMVSGRTIGQSKMYKAQLSAYLGAQLTVELAKSPNTLLV